MQALEGAGEIREVVDADCVSDGLDQCAGLCTVKHSSPRAYAPADAGGRSPDNSYGPNRSKHWHNCPSSVGQAWRSFGPSVVYLLALLTPE